MTNFWDSMVVLVIILLPIYTSPLWGKKSAPLFQSIYPLLSFTCHCQTNKLTKPIFFFLAASLAYFPLLFYIPGLIKWVLSYWSNETQTLFLQKAGKPACPKLFLHTGVNLSETHLCGWEDLLWADEVFKRENIIFGQLPCKQKGSPNKFLKVSSLNYLYSHTEYMYIRLFLYSRYLKEERQCQQAALKHQLGWISLWNSLFLSSCTDWTWLLQASWSLWMPWHNSLQHC